LRKFEEEGGGLAVVTAKPRRVSSLESDLGLHDHLTERRGGQVPAGDDARELRLDLGRCPVKREFKQPATLRKLVYLMSLLNQ